MTSLRFVFLDVDSLLDGLRRADHLVPLVPGANSTRDLRLQMKPFTSRVCGDSATATPVDVRCRHAVFQKTTPVLAHALGLSGWTMTDRAKSPHTSLQKAVAQLLLPDAAKELNEDEEEAAEVKEASDSDTKTLVVVTGDTAEDVVKGRFREILRAFLDLSDHWQVEIHTWTHTLADAFLLLAQEHADRVKIQFLDKASLTLDAENENDAAIDPSSIVYCASPPTPNALPKPKPSSITTASKSPGDSPGKKASPANIKSRKPGFVLPALIHTRLKRIHALRQRDLPDAYSAAGRLRYVVIDADNIFLSMRNATHLHPLLANASSVNDLRLNFKALTNRVCNSALGFKDDLVRELKAMHYVVPTWLIKGLLTCRWTVEKQLTVMDACLHQELRRLLQEVMEEDEEEGDSEEEEEETPKRTLVLVTGDGNDDEVATSASFRGIVDEYLAAGWSVEIHAWTHALHTAYIDLMETRPQDVVVRPLDGGQGLEPWEEDSNSTDASSSSLVSTRLVFASPSDGSESTSPAFYTPPAMRKPVVITTQPQTIDTTAVPAEVVDAIDAQSRIRQLEAALARTTRDKQAMQMQMQLMMKAHDTRVQQLSRERWDAFGACLKAITCPITGQVLEEPVLLACCRVAMSKAAALELRESEAGCPQCYCVAFKMLSVPALDEVVQAVMDHVPT